MKIRKLDIKNRMRTYWVAPCEVCKEPHEILLEHYKRANRVRHSKCFLRTHNFSEALKGKHRRTKDKMINIVIQGYKRSAIRRGLEWALDREEFYNISQLSCTYCGIPPVQRHSRELKGEPIYLFNGIDRVNNTLGYTIDNCVACCYQCNCSKRNLIEEDWLGYLSRLTKFRSNLNA